MILVTEMVKQNLQKCQNCHDKQVWTIQAFSEFLNIGIFFVDYIFSKGLRNYMLAALL